MKNKNFDNYFNNSHLSDEAIALFADALILNKEVMLPAAILDHVEECQQCKKEILALYEIMKKDNVIQNIEHPYLNNSEVNEKKSFKIVNLLKIAAVLLLIAGISSLIYYVFISSKNTTYSNNLITHNSDTIIKHKNDTDSLSKKVLKNDSLKPSSDNTLAVYMKESTLFENLIVSQYRSNDIEMSYPPLNHSFNSGQKIVFKISGELTGSILLIIYTNIGEKIIEKSYISAKSISINKKLSPGLYYWKLLKDDNLLQVGKFFVR